MKEKILRMYKEEKTELCIQIFAMVIFIVLTTFFMVLNAKHDNIIKNLTQMHEEQYKAIQEVTQENYVYVICDVMESYEELQDDIYITNLVCNMPNGELHIYTIEDAPEGTVELVCLRTDNQDDYKSYEVVGVR